MFGSHDFRGLLFDFDGTLARTIEDHFLAWKSALDEYGVTLLPEYYFPREGTSPKALSQEYCQKFSLSIDADEIVRKKENYYLQNHRHEFYPGVEDLIDKLHQKRIPMAVVTAGLRNRLANSVPAEFLSKFNVLITSDRYKEGKPDPEPYLMGAQALGLPPSACIVVENAPLGILSGKRAGAYCIAICSTVKRLHLEEADEIVDHFEQLGELNVIRRLLI